MKLKKFSDAMGELDTKYVAEAINYEKKEKKHRLVKWLAMAACLAAALVVGVFSVSQQKDRITLSDNSANVTAYYINNPFIFVNRSECLIYLTEEELFTTFDTAIFKGTVSQVRNIVVNFNGDKVYRAIAEIEVEKVYRGIYNAGDTILAMLPCPLGNGILTTDTNTLSAMKAGTTGIFMPMIYADYENYIWEENGAKLDKRDIADCEFADGERYAFLETEAGLVFSKTAYSSIADATTLEEIEDYIRTMLEKLDSRQTQ